MVVAKVHVTKVHAASEAVKESNFSAEDERQGRVRHHLSLVVAHGRH